MTSVTTFNDMMEQFLTELEMTFPEETSFKTYRAKFDLVRKSNPRKIPEAFAKGIGPYAGQIMQKDESLFTGAVRDEDEPQFFKDLHIKKHWNADLSENTKNAIWQYLQTLNILSITINAIPPEMLQMVEGAAAKCAESMQNGGSMDTSSLMSSMSGLFSSLMGGTNNKLM